MTKKKHNDKRNDANNTSTDVDAAEAVPPSTVENTEIALTEVKPSNVETPSKEETLTERRNNATEGAETNSSQQKKDKKLDVDKEEHEDEMMKQQQQQNEIKENQVADTSVEEPKKLHAVSIPPLLKTENKSRRQLMSEKFQQQPPPLIVSKESDAPQQPQVANKFKQEQVLVQDQSSQQQDVKYEQPDSQIPQLIVTLHKEKLPQAVSYNSSQVPPGVELNAYYNNAEQYDINSAYAYCYSANAAGDPNAVYANGFPKGKYNQCGGAQNYANQQYYYQQGENIFYNAHAPPAEPARTLEENIFLQLTEEQRNVVKELESNQEQYDKIEEKFELELVELKMKYHKLKQPLHDERFDILNRKVEESSSTIGTPALPNFWLQAMKNNARLEPEIYSIDAPILSYLKDIQFEWAERKKGDEGFKLIFAFVENPYFEPTVLEKIFYTVIDEDNDVVLERTKSTKINWKPGKDIDEARKILEKQYESGLCIRDVIISNAINWYLGKIHEESEESEGEEEESEGEEEEEDEEEEEEQKAPRSLASWFF